mgnify:CR=1 FL=1
MNDTHIVIFSRLSQEKIDPIVKKEIDYINELKIKKVEDPIIIREKEIKQEKKQQEEE